MENTNAKYPTSEGWNIVCYNTSDVCAGLPAYPVYERINPKTGRREFMNGEQLDQATGKRYAADGTEIDTTISPEDTASFADLTKGLWADEEEKTHNITAEFAQEIKAAQDSSSTGAGLEQAGWIYHYRAAAGADPNWAKYNWQGNVYWRDRVGASAWDIMFGDGSEVCIITE